MLRKAMGCLWARGYVRWFDVYMVSLVERGSGCEWFWEKGFEILI